MRCCPLLLRPRQDPGGGGEARVRPHCRGRSSVASRVSRHPATPQGGLTLRGRAAAAPHLARPLAARPGLRNKGWHRCGAGRDLIGSILAFHSSLLCPSEIILTLR